MTIFDIITAGEITSYWENMTKDRAPYLGETLFPVRKQLSLDLKWIKGSAGLPVVLTPSAFDAKAIMIERAGFDKLSTQMPFFKQGAYIDEEIRQQLNMVMDSGNQSYIDTITGKVFDDKTRLLEGAAAQRERMRMMALTTGAIAITANGQSYAYDYGVPATHKVETSVAWSNPQADIGADIEAWMDKIEEDTGVRPTRAVCRSSTFKYFLSNEKFKKAIYILSNGQATITKDQMRNYISNNYGLDITTYDKKYKAEDGTPTNYVPADTFVIFPTGNLGYTNFGTTPEESDLMSNPNIANVSITDTGVAVTTTKQADPVQVETKVSMVTLPSFEMADQIIIADVSHTDT